MSVQQNSPAGAGVTDTQWANTITTWESLGYKVNTVPYKK